MRQNFREGFDKWRSTGGTGPRRAVLSLSTIWHGAEDWVQLIEAGVRLTAGRLTTFSNWPCS